MSRRASWWGGAFAALALAFLYAPLVITVLFSFHRTPGLSLPFTGFSTRWYDELFGSPDFVAALRFSVRVAVTVTVVTMVAAVPTAYGLASTRRRLGNGVNGLVLLPIALPSVFVATSLLVFFHSIGVQNSFATVVVGQFIVTLPIAVLLLRGAFERLSGTLVEIARDLGAGPVGVFFRVVLPITWPFILGAGCLTFLASFDEFPITFFLIGNDSTVPMFLQSLLTKEVTPMINAVSTLLMAVSQVLFLCAAGALYLARVRDRELRTGIGDIHVA
ncbi:ABC transporter permease [Pseudonocardia acaciae]|uniref:ABC transporter permease n=1 Tax=Pseudonocardia acaciae TaxID=551276 RepID=UPI0007E8CEE4|nr:ABC transporter permease [Pseudonocardia acaciae]